VKVNGNAPRTGYNIPVGDSDIDPVTKRIRVTLYHPTGDVARVACFGSWRGADRVIESWFKNPARIAAASLLEV
jgi:hypothetical protein